MSKKIYPMKLIELAFQDIPSGLVGPFDRSTILRAVDLPGQPEYRWNGAKWVASVTSTTDLTGGITKIAKLTQAEYDALAAKDDSTLYVIVT